MAIDKILIRMAHSSELKHLLALVPKSWQTLDPTPRRQQLGKLDLFARYPPSGSQRVFLLTLGPRLVQLGADRDKFRVIARRQLERAILPIRGLPILFGLLNAIL